MSDRSKIEWTDATWNPLRARHRATGKVGWHCVKISPACEHCYAAA
jgi:protein gp37